MTNMQQEEELYRFELGNIHLCVLYTDDSVYLTSPTHPHLPRMVLGLPAPGHYNTSTLSSTSDERGERTLRFAPLKTGTDEVIIEVTAHDVGEYWYYGSMGDDWHPTESTTRHRLTVRKVSDGIEYELKRAE